MGGTSRSRSFGPGLLALAGTTAWWACFFVLGSFAATVLYGLLFVAASIRFLASARRNGWAQASARAGRALALATALTSAVLVAYGLLGGGSRRVTEDLMELGLIHLALVGPLFLLAVFLAWLGRAHEAPARLYYAVYPGSWIAMFLLERMV